MNTDLRARLTDALAAAEGKSNAKLVDIRSADEYSGKIFAPAGVPELSIRAGPHSGRGQCALGPGGQGRRHLQVGRRPESSTPAWAWMAAGTIITYCRIGERSSHTWFALSKILCATA